MSYDEQKAKVYDTNIRKSAPWYDLMHRVVVSCLVAAQPSPKNVLIVGAGTGIELIGLGAVWPDAIFTAVDPSLPMLEIAKRKLLGTKLLDRVNFVCGHVNELPTAKLFDAATLQLVLHSISSNEEKLSLISNIINRLKSYAPISIIDIGSPPEIDTASIYLKAWDKERKDAGYVSMPGYPKDLFTISEGKLIELLLSLNLSQPLPVFRCLMFGAWIARVNEKR